MQPSPRMGLGDGFSLAALVAALSILMLATKYAYAV
jgi:hypothetical protein